jgi:Flp pilus assembly protein TadG
VIGRRRPGRDRGSFTAEFAAGLPALILLLLAGLTAVAAVTAKGQCVDAAREGALAGSRGEGADAAAARVAPAGATVQIDEGEDTVAVVVRARVRLLGAHLPVITVTGRAVAAREPDLVDGAVS